MKKLTGLLKLWPCGLKNRLGLLLTVVLCRVQVQLASPTQQLQLLTNYWNSFPLWRALCPAKTVPAFDIKKTLTGHCERGCLQRSTGCSHCLTHTKNAILEGQSRIISHLASKGGSSYMGCFRLLVCRTQECFNAQVPHQTMLWFYLMRRLRMHHPLKFFHLHEGSLIFLFSFFWCPCKSMLLVICQFLSYVAYSSHS